MITIYNDFEKTVQIKPDDYTWVACQPDEYIPLRQRIRRALDDRDHHYTVYIQHRILAEWLRDLRDYPSYRLRWEEINLREKFRQKFGFLPPSGLDDTDIQELQLLDLPLPARSEIDDPTGWILGRHLASVWQPKKPPPGHLADLAAWAVKASPIKESLASLANARVAQWQQLDARYQIFFDHSWQTAGEQILLKWALQTYPTDFSLRQQSTAAPKEDCHRYRQLAAEILGKYDAELRQFWRLWFAPSRSPDIEAVVQLMSGLASAELDSLENWLHANPAYLTAPLLDTINHRFVTLSRVNQTIKRLENLITPDVPQTPDNSWSAETWLTWATDEYMPYLAWTLRHNQTRDTQISLANQFADWLVSAYPRLMFDKSAPFITNQPSHLQKIVDTGQADVVFWLIVDGLTWWQGKGLVDNFVKYGLTIAQLEPNLSALPSLTFISKRALAQGYLDQSTEKQPIKKILEDRLLRDTSSAHIFTQTTQFEAVISSDLQPGIYVLLYNALDRHNHDTQNFTDDESVEGHLRLLARLTNDGFQQCTRQGLRARALVSSDHGSTLLPSNTDVLSVPSFAQIIDDENGLDDMPSKSKDIYQRTRACTINNLPDEKELTRLEQDWYLLRGDIFNLPQHFLIPKGYAAVKRRPTGWTHGGGTPEETVTAFIEVQPEAIEIIPPVVEVEGFLLPDQTSTLQITIVNPNSTPLRTVRFNFANMPPSVEVTKISPNSQTSSDFSAPIATSKGKTQALEWQFTCEVGGRTWQFSGREEIPVRRFQVSEVDDLFEDML